MRAAGPVAHARRAQLPVPARPPGGRGVGDLEPFRGPAQRPAVIDSTPGQAQPPGLAQRGITVDHEDLLVQIVVIHTEPERSSSLQDHLPCRVNNVRGQYT
jgi:hypothetical protein